MTVQLAYTKEANVALPGLIYDIGNTNIDSFAAEGSVGFGLFVKRGTTPAQVATDDDGTAIGVSVRYAKENSFGGTQLDTNYNDTETVGVLRGGFIWCEFDAAGGTVDEDVTLDATGKVVAAGGGTALSVISATVEIPAVAIERVDGPAKFVGLVNVKG